MAHMETTTLEPIHPQPLTDQQLAQLMRDLNPARVAKRKQGGAQLSYLQAWDVKATLIRVFGFGGFSADATDCEIVRIENNVPKYTGYGDAKKELPIEYTKDGQIKFGTANFRVTARVRVQLAIPQLGAVYSEWAASSQTGPDLGEVTDFAIKTAESDALKRAAIYLGTQFGLSLYDNGSTAEVIKAVFAPGQEWLRGTRINPETGLPVATKGAEPAAPASAGGSVSHLRPNGVTEEQHVANLALLDQAMTAKRNQREQSGGAMNPHSGPVATDPDFGGDSGGKSEGMAYEN